MNSRARGNSEVVELWGREFNLVKNGLSEDQVVSFVTDFAKQQDVLRQRQEHLIDLNARAERTVSEADKLAAEFENEARKQAQERAASMIAEAQASAKSEAARLLGEADALAEKTAKEIEEMAIEDADKLAGELKKNAEAEAERVISEAEARGRHIIEQKEAEAASAASAQAEAIVSKARQEASTMLEREKRRVQPQISQFMARLQTQLLSDLGQFKNQLGELQPQSDNSEPERKGHVPEPPRQGAERQDEFLDLMKESGSAESGEPTWEIEIMAPIDIMRIMSIVGQIDALSGVVKTEIIPRNDRTSIIVYTGRSIKLLNALRTFAEVAHAEEDKSHQKEKAGPRRLSISLWKNGTANKIETGDEYLPETGA